MITVEAAQQLQSLLMCVSQLSRGTFKTCCLGQLMKTNACQHSHNVDVDTLSLPDQLIDKRLQQTDCLWRLALSCSQQWISSSKVQDIIPHMQGHVSS